MAHIAYAQERVGEKRDESGAFTIIRRPVTEVEVCIYLTNEEAALLRAHRGNRRLTVLLGPALKWEFNAKRCGAEMPPRATALHSVASNPHGVRTTERIAARTLWSLQELLDRLKATREEARPR